MSRVGLRVGGAAVGITLLLTRLAACSSFETTKQAEPEPPKDDATVDAPPDVLDASLDVSMPVVAVAVGPYHACAIVAGGKLKCWGSNRSGELGLGDTVDRGDRAATMGDALPFVDLGANAKVIAVAAGGEISLVNEPVDASVDASSDGSADGGFDAGFVKVAPVAFTCALIEGGEVKCWGTNDYGTLGRDNADAIGTGPNQMGDNLAPINLGLPAVAIGAGGRHACALLANKKMKCWGLNGLGQLGLGDRKSRGAVAGDMGSLPFVDVGGDVEAISVGWLHTCAILTGGSVKCWGYGIRGQTGGGTSDEIGVDGGMGSALPPVDLGTGVQVKKLTAGVFGTCAITLDGRLKCWGYNGVGNLGLEDSQDRGADAAGMGDALPFVDVGDIVLDATLGYYSTCALLAGGNVKCWGGGVAGFEGLTGSNDNQRRGQIKGTMGNNLLPVNLGGTAFGLDLYVSQTCVVLANGVKCFGANRFGGLGQGTTTPIGGEVGDMGGLKLIDLGN